jgi:hypothetical protein
MGIEVLENHFDVRILDCTDWLMPSASARRSNIPFSRENLRRITSFSDLRDELAGQSGGLAIDYVGQFSLRAILLFYALKSCGFRLVVLDSGSHPIPAFLVAPRSFMQKVWGALFAGDLSRQLSAQCAKLFLRILPNQSPDAALVAGDSWKTNPRFRSAARQIPAHSFDYETFRNVQGSSNFLDGDYAVYLDENIAGHEDNAELGLAHPTTAEHFFPAFKAFLDAFEEAEGMPVVVAGYPSANYSGDDRFGNRAVYFGKTAELIRNARLVFVHASTATSFVVLWRRPVVFLTNWEILSSWYEPWIEARQEMLRAPLINIDEQVNRELMDNWWHVNETAYRRYENQFIRSSEAPNLSLWEIFTQFAQSETLSVDRSETVVVR